MSKSELVLIDTAGLSPSAVFVEGGIEKILAEVEQQTRSAAELLDATTPKGREEIKSLAYKVSRSKTALEGMGDALKADAKRIVDAVNSDLRIVRSRMDALRDEVRKPVDDYDAREAARVDAHRSVIAEIEALCRFDAQPDEGSVAERLAKLGDLAQRNSEEFYVSATLAIDRTRTTLDAHAVAARQRRIECEEAARLEARRLEEERIAAEAAKAKREAEIARQAAEAARIEAERKARAEKDRIENERLAAVRAAELAEARRVEAEEKAARDRVAAEKLAEARRLQAIEDERRRVAAEAEAIKVEEVRRAADKAHRARINREILTALESAGIETAIAKSVIGAVARGAVPHMTISY